MHISNGFVIACNIQIVIQMLYHSFEMLLLLSFFYLMVKSGKPFVLTGSYFQIALFYFTKNLNAPAPFIWDPRVIFHSYNHSWRPD